MNTISRRGFLKLAGSGLTMTLLAGCSVPPEDVAPTEAPTEAATPGNTPTPLPTQEPTQEPTPDVSLDVKIGQMLMIGFRGLEVEEDYFIVQDIRERHLGGVVLFDYDIPSQSPVRNIASPAQVRALIASLQSVSDAALLVAVDHEGGMVTRLNERCGFPSTLSHQRLGEIDDLKVTYEQAASMAETLAELGVNLNLAPVVDVNTNPDNPIIAKYERSFSADPQVVTRHALEFIKAHHEQGVCCTLKHFPGHGSSAEDSHLRLADVTDTWSPIELEPYAAIIEAGQADAIMTAHVFNANLDPDYPATLSHATITGMLRKQLGYDGVALSDDMQMRAIADHYGFETAVQKAIEAGVDVILFANNRVYEEDIATRAVALVKRLLEEGTISQARIEESYQRICRLKSRFSAGG